MQHRFVNESERQLQLKLISAGYEESKGLKNTIELDIDGKYIRQHPIIDEDEDLEAVKESVARLIYNKRTTNILFVVNIYRQMQFKTHKCIMVHLCNPNEENAYIAICKRKGSRKFLTEFEKIDFGDKTKGLFGDIFELRRFAI